MIGPAWPSPRVVRVNTSVDSNRSPFLAKNGSPSSGRTSTNRLVSLASLAASSDAASVASSEVGASTTTRIDETGPGNAVSNAFSR